MIYHSLVESEKSTLLCRNISGPRAMFEISPLGLFFHWTNYFMLILARVGIPEIIFSLQECRLSHSRRIKKEMRIKYKKSWA